jgi:hypothetical protein
MEIRKKKFWIILYKGDTLWKTMTKSERLISVRLGVFTPLATISQSQKAFFKTWRGLILSYMFSAAAVAM